MSKVNKIEAAVKQLKINLANEKHSLEMLPLHLDALKAKYEADLEDLDENKAARLQRIADIEKQIADMAEAKAKVIDEEAKAKEAAKS